ncbi:Short-chain dehydrogenase/reductase SDR [Penicillium concentricum]|uniref:Short-chain dehydrogenase/reductase SDR n=1 Tax=Penicillium concentricum TaxID=293559 RepID=A0A9W9VJ54_9EURO|nr:Short-chain dehydrogenase/reductase SDR [Penicillium concentricum]KAJ5384143.1 Short-chain dehydrogenase/reductase SDR [Penicillium concentricum]
MASYLVTGSSRGLGLALIARLATLPKTEVGTIIATARKDNSAQLKEIASASSGRVQMVKLDVTDESSVKEAVAAVERQLQGKGLDYLVNNAGVSDWSPTGLEGMDNLNETFNVNVTAAHLVSRAFLPLLRKGEKKTVINISTTVGSIAMADAFQHLKTPAYKISKAALNMLTVQYAQQYADDGFTFLAISPGWLRTDLGSDRADLPVETGAEKVLDIIQKATPDQNGKFVNIHLPGSETQPGANQYDGKEIPW